MCLPIICLIICTINMLPKSDIFSCQAKAKVWRTACADSYTTSYNIESENMHESNDMLLEEKGPVFAAMSILTLDFLSSPATSCNQMYLCCWGIFLKWSWKVGNVRRKCWFYFQRLLSDHGVPVVRLISHIYACQQVRKVSQISLSLPSDLRGLLDFDPTNKDRAVLLSLRLWKVWFKCSFTHLQSSLRARKC